MEGGHSSIEVSPPAGVCQQAAVRHEAAIRLDGLTKRFKDVTAVDRVTFSVNAGEVFGFMGHNGAQSYYAARGFRALLRV